jgi:hypothetical protein
MIGANDQTTQHVCKMRARRANAPRVIATMQKDEEGKPKPEIKLVMPLPRISWREVYNIMLDADGKCSICNKQVWLEGVLDINTHKWTCVYHDSNNGPVV